MHSEGEVLADPNFAKYTKMGRGLEDYSAITHPSQPNYLTIVGGDYFNHASDDPVDLDDTNIVDLLDAQGLTWRGYVRLLSYSSHQRRYVPCSCHSST